MKRALTSLLISAAMVIGPLPAMSADTGPLPAGTVAGVKQAQGKDDDDTTPILWLVGAGVVIGLGILILSNNNNNAAAAAAAATTTTTTTTGTKATTTTTTTTTTT